MPRPPAFVAQKQSNRAIHFKDIIVKFNEELGEGLVCKEPRRRKSFISRDAFHVVGTLGYKPLLQTNL